MTEFIKIILIKGSFETDSDFTKFDYGTVLTATSASKGNGADVLVSDLEAAGAVVDIGGADVTEQDGAPLFYFSNGLVPRVYNKEYEVINES